MEVVLTWWLMAVVTMPILGSDNAVDHVKIEIPFDTLSECQAAEKAQREEAQAAGHAFESFGCVQRAS